MADSHGSPTLQDLQDAIKKRASEDEAFRAELLADPRRALDRATGKAVPPGVDIQVEDGPANEVGVTLTPKSSGELSDEELSGVSGGQTQDESVIINWLNQTFSFLGG